MDFFGERNFQRFFSDAVGIVLRTTILFTIDFAINGALITFISHHADLSIKPSVYDVLFAVERQNMTNLWNELSWSDYCFWYYVYLSVIVGGICAFFIDTTILLAWISYIGPIFLVIFCLSTSFNDSWIFSARAKPNLLDFFGEGGGGPSSYKTFLAYWFRLTTCGWFGYGMSRVYFSCRRPMLRQFSALNSDNDGSMMNSVLAVVLRLPFFVPFFNTILGGQRVTSAVTWTIFIPLLANEVHCVIFVIYRLVVPYFLVGRIRITEFFGRQDLFLRIQMYVILIWRQLQIPCVFRTFFCARTAVQLIYVVYVALLLGPQNDPYGVFTKRQWVNDWLWTGETLDNDRVPLSTDSRHYVTFISAFEYLFARCCETAPAVMATASVVSVLGHWSSCVFRWLLTGKRRIRAPGRGRHPAGVQAANVDEDEDVDPDDDQESVGSLTGALFLILCMQTGLTTLPAEKRLWRLYRNLWLLFIAVLHFDHHMVNSTMNRLCTHGRFPWSKHIRAVLLGVCLLFAPYLFFKCLWRHNNWMNPWLISVAIFAIELTAKMFISFVVYGLMLMDLRYQRVATEEILYAVKTVGAVTDFLFGLCLLINGVWILFYEHGGILRTIMICIHGYFNIYQRAKRGLTQLRRRRMATRKLDTLQTATRQRLVEARDEVCPICYVELYGENVQDASTSPSSWIASEVKITSCGHLLHSACLLKWLYIRDACPLCHRTVFNDQSLRDGDLGQNVDDIMN